MERLAAHAGCDQNRADETGKCVAFGVSVSSYFGDLFINQLEDGGNLLVVMLMVIQNRYMQPLRLRKHTLVVQAKTT